MRLAFAPFIVIVIYMGIVHSLFGEYSLILNQGVVHMEGGSSAARFFNFVSEFLSSVAVMVFYINGFRYAAMGEGGDTWWTFALNWRLVNVYVYALLMGLAVVLYGLVAGGIVIGSYFLVENLFLPGLIALLFTLGLIYLMSRFSLTLLYVAIDQKEALRTSWHIMKGNVLRFLGVIFLITLVFLGMVLLLTIIGFVGFSLAKIYMWPKSVIISILTSLSILMWLVTFALTIKAIALVNKQLTEKK